jgi:hypothetical protein
MLPVGLARGASRASALLMVLLLVSCGGGEGEEGARPTISPSRTPTATRPSSGLPSPTRSREPTKSPAVPSPTRSPEPTKTAEQPGAQPSSEPSSLEPASETPTPSPAETQQPSGKPVDESAEDEGVPTWVWWLLAALVVGSAVAIPLVVRARRRNAWRQELAEAESELAWFARELLPELRRAGSHEEMAGGWAVGRARVAAAEDRLTGLESTAPDDAGRQRARSLRDATRQARTHMERLTGAEPHDTWVLDLDAIIADLEDALRSPQASSPE